MFNQVSVYQQPPTTGFSQRQSNASANNSQAKAFASSDPRYTAKAFDKAGFSRGRGQMSQGAAKGAEAFANNMAQAQETRLQDQSYNAQQQLDNQNRNQQFGFALAGLNEDLAQTGFNNKMQMSNALSGLFQDDASAGSPQSQILQQALSLKAQKRSLGR